MKRLPIIPTLFVLAAVAVMVALGIWQLQRAGWKDRLLAELAVAGEQPAVDLDPLIARGGDEAPAIAFRNALVSCQPVDAAPDLRAGRSVDGQTGFGVFVPCRPGASGWAGRLQVNAGWTSRVDGPNRIALPAIVAGRIGTVEPGAPIILTAASAPPPLRPSAAPSVDDIPNNHLMYAGQWFFFAATALLIYGLALRRRRPVAPPPREP